MSPAPALHVHARGLAPLALALALACGDDGASPSAESTTVSDAGDIATGSGSSSAAADTTAADDAPGSTGADSTGGPIVGCWDDLAFGEVEVFYEGFDDGSEGIAFGADGKLYATTNVDGDGRVWQLDAAGTATELASVPYALGLAARAEGGFVVASIGETDAPDGAVWIVDAAGAATPLATGIDSPNFVTIAPDGSALVSDDFDTRVFRVELDGPQAGDVSVAIADVPSPNGMAYAPDGSALYVASTFTPEAQLTRYDVDADGMPVEASAIEILQLGAGTTPDGIAVDIDGFVYVAANIAGELWRVDGSATALVEGERVASELGTPASLAFGRGAGFDPCSIYLTQLFSNRILRVGIGVEGAPLYD